MDNERIREFCLGLPHVAESVNWGHHLVFWVGDKAIGGRMFALIHLDDLDDLDTASTGVVWFHCGAERFHALLETDGVIPAPYLAHAFWVTIERWNAFGQRQWEDELRQAHQLIYNKLPKRTKSALALPEKERAKPIRESRKAPGMR